MQIFCGTLMGNNRPRPAAKVDALKATGVSTGSPVLGSPTLTVSDLAAALAPIAPNVANTVQRIGIGPAKTHSALPNSNMADLGRIAGIAPMRSIAPQCCTS